MTKQTAIVAVDENGIVFDFQLFGNLPSQLSEDQATAKIKRRISDKYDIRKAVIVVGEKI